MFLAGGPGANLNAFQYNVPADQGPSSGDFPMPPDIGSNVWFIVAAVIAAALLIGLLFLLVGSIMEFVPVESRRREVVTVHPYCGKRWRQGVRLFGFRLVIGLLVFGSAAVVAVFFLLPVVVETGTGPGHGHRRILHTRFLLLLPVVFVLARVPVVAYLRYDALLVLGDIESDLDLIPERRAAVRADEG